MNRWRVLLASLAVVATLGLGACGDDGGSGGSSSTGCVSGNGAKACVADDGKVTLEGFLPGSTVTLTITSGTTTTRATATTGASGTGATGASGSGATTSQSIVAGTDGKGSGTVAATRGSILVRGVSATNRPVNLTLTLG